MTPTPTIGRIVYYKTTTSEVWPAIVTKVEGNRMSLTVFKVQEETYADAAISAMAAGPNEAQDGQWWWPERL